MSDQQTILQQQSIADTSTDWQQVLPFEQFDPSLGTLDSINIGVTADIAGSVSVESLEAAASTVDIGQFGNLSVNGPTGINLVNDPVDFFGASALGAYDGTTDYGGTSGTVVAVANTGTASVTLSSSTTDLGPFVGTGSVALSAYANVALNITGPANMQIDSQASVGGTVDLQYNYASTTTAGPGGGGGVVTTTYTPPLPPFEIANAVTATPLVVAVPERHHRIEHSDRCRAVRSVAGGAGSDQRHADRRSCHQRVRRKRGRLGGLRLHDAGCDGEPLARRGLGNHR